MSLLEYSLDDQKNPYQKLYKRQHPHCSNPENLTDIQQFQLMIIPNTMCKLASMGIYCTNCYCNQTASDSHGMAQRIISAAKWKEWNWSNGLIWITANVGAFIMPSQLRFLCSGIHAFLRRHYPKVYFCYRVEWVCGVPHINIVIDASACDTAIKKLFKPYWTGLLGKIGKTAPSKQHVWCRHAVNDDSGYVIDYIWKTGMPDNSNSLFMSQPMFGGQGAMTLDYVRSWQYPKYVLGGGSR